MSQEHSITITVSREGAKADTQNAQALEAGLQKIRDQLAPYTGSGETSLHIDWSEVAEGLLAVYVLTFGPGNAGLSLQRVVEFVTQQLTELSKEIGIDEDSWNVEVRSQGGRIATIEEYMAAVNRDLNPGDPGLLSYNDLLAALSKTNPKDNQNN